MNQSAGQVTQILQAAGAGDLTDRAQRSLAREHGRPPRERNDFSRGQTELLRKLKREAWHAQNKKTNIENEGESHDVVDNKAPNFLSHDVIENKAA